AREVQPLRDHLGAEQDIELAVLHALENLVMRPLRGCRVDVHARDARVREPVRDLALDLFRADAAVGEVGAAAAVAAIGRRLLVKAVVADEPSSRTVVRQRHVALRAVPYRTARAALYERRVAAPVEQQDRLLVAGE